MWWCWASVLTPPGGMFGRSAAHLCDAGPLSMSRYRCWCRCWYRCWYGCWCRCWCRCVGGVVVVPTRALDHCCHWWRACSSCGATEALPAHEHGVACCLLLSAGVSRPLDHAEVENSIHGRFGVCYNRDKALGGRFGVCQGPAERQRSPQASQHTHSAQRQHCAPLLVCRHLPGRVHAVMTASQDPRGPAPPPAFVTVLQVVHK